MFVSLAKEKIIARSDESTYTERQYFKPSIDKIVASVCENFSVSASEVHRSTRGRGAKNIARSVAMYVAHQAGGYRLTDIAGAFSLNHYGSV